MIFLQSIFGYLVVCILYKWSIDWSSTTTQPPSLLNMLISMFLEPGTIAPGAQLYRGQSTVQVILLLLAAVCIPWLLITKPYLAWKEMHKIQGQGYVGINHGDDGHRNSTDDALEGEEEGNGRAMTGEADTEHVRYFCLLGIRVVNVHFLFGICRSSTTSVRLLYIKSFILSSSVLDAFHTPLPIFGCGPCLSHMRNCRRYYGL